MFRTDPHTPLPPATAARSLLGLALLVAGLAAVTAALVLLAATSVCSAASLDSLRGADSASADLGPLNPLFICGRERGFAFASPRGIAMNGRYHEILLASTGSHSIEVFDLQGRQRVHYVHRVPQADGTMVDGEPRWLAQDALGRTLVDDNLDTHVDVVDLHGQSIKRFALKDSGATLDGEAPGALAVLRDSTIVVATRGDQGRLYFFSPRYQPRGSWGESGREPGQLSQVTAVAEMPDGGIVVAGGNTQNAVQIFTREGKFVLGFGKHDLGPGTFSYPSGLAVTGDGRIWASDEIRHQIMVFDGSGNLLHTVGGWGTGPGQFLFPSSLATDGKSYLVVAERVGERFQLLAIR